MAKLWQGRTKAGLNKSADSFNSSIAFDKRLYKEDIKGSIAHAFMLGTKGIIDKSDSDSIIKGLEGIYSDIESGALKIDMSAEDIHMFIEQELTKRIGDAGKKLHTARSRNDQTVLDLRLNLRKETDAIIKLLKTLISALSDKAKDNASTIMPGYTHLQRAQPITFGHHLLAYAFMLIRDCERLIDGRKRLNLCPLGSAALAGTTYDIDRELTAEELGFDGITHNSIDSVSDRDFCTELLSNISIIMMHLSRFSEELVLWSSWEFAFTEFSEEFSTGSSIMPQKKNPDMAELIRGKTGRAYGNLISLLTVLKGLPLAYNKDMQEDKEAIFDSVDTVKVCLELMALMVQDMEVKKENMRAAAAKGFINATDCADYLVYKGLAFRQAYKITGEIVSKCISDNKTLETFSLSEYKQFSDLFESDIYEAISLEKCVIKRNSKGGTSPLSVYSQIKVVEKFLGGY
ncbi:MAG TPA: argininosuccinate lyase [Oscillospiraceae bacterium]|nr:argininosuccinate lyase [Oscillospiraceae bacterium]